jgi:CubicO group peptidase (beta-lactamase class C family)
LLVATAVGCSDDPEPQTTPDIPERYRPFALALERELGELEIPGAAVAILEHGQVSFAHGFGTKGMESDDPIDERTLFRVGSMSKLLTAIGVMSAVDDGLLDLDAPVRESIPDLSLTAPETEELTLRVLLSHQSGLSDYLALPGPAEDSALGAFTSGPELADNVHFTNPAGLFWNYSNPNFYIAGRALEAATGLDYRDAVAERVFAPLGMERSFFLPGEALADGNYSDGYGVLDFQSASGSFENLPPDAYDNAWARPAGFAYSNVLDWVHVMQFLMGGEPGVLSEPARQEVTTSQISTQTIYSDLKTTALGLADDYGLGVGVGEGFFMDKRAEPETYYAVPYLGHGGDIPGFAATYCVFPSTGFGIVVLSNRDAARPVRSMRLALESFAELPAPSAPPPGSNPDPSRFLRYAGTYVDDGAAAVNVSVESGEVSVSGPLLDALGIPYESVLEPTSLDNFDLWLTLQGERIPLEVTFIVDPDGNYTWFRSRLAVARKTPIVTDRALWR